MKTWFVIQYRSKPDGPQPFWVDYGWPQYSSLDLAREKRNRLQKHASPGDEFCIIKKTEEVVE